MPLIDAQPDAVARVYAKSLAELAHRGGGKDLVSSVLDELRAVLELARRDPAFSEFLTSRVVSAEARGAALRRIFEGRSLELTARFMGVLNDHGRLSHLPAIVAAFDEIAQTSFGRVKIEVSTAGAMSDAEREDLRARLSAAVGKDVALEPRVEPAMIGGIKFKIGDQLLDGSVSTSLRRVRDQFDGDGASRLRAAAESIMQAV